MGLRCLFFRGIFGQQVEDGLVGLDVLLAQLRYELSRVVRQVTGRTVIDYINQMLLMEASFLLRTTSMSITQIADRLHFADSPSFSKFFSRLKGLSPKEYKA